jgi:succinate dehydrogenase / fumarate reductase cytochrome b subunit
VDTPAASDSFLVRHEFLIRRLHSLSGLIPVGAYMCVHLLVNATVLDSPATFQTQVNRIHSLGSLLPVVEWGFIFLPILFHAIIGVVIIRGGLPNTSNYPYAKNFRYTLQRATGMIAFVFIVVHVLHMHQLGDAVGGGKFDPHHATSSAASALSDVFVAIAYAIGVLSCVFHLANGLWTMGITWGLWTSAAAQRRANYVSIAFGLGLAAVSMGALGGFSLMGVEKINAAKATETRMQKAHDEIMGVDPNAVEEHGSEKDSDNEDNGEDEDTVAQADS